MVRENGRTKRLYDDDDDDGGGGGGGGAAESLVYPAHRASAFVSPSTAQRGSRGENPVSIGPKCTRTDAMHSHGNTTTMGTQPVKLTYTKAPAERDLRREVRARVFTPRALGTRRNPGKSNLAGACKLLNQLISYSILPLKSMSCDSMKLASLLIL